MVCKGRVSRTSSNSSDVSSLGILAWFAGGSGSDLSAILSGTGRDCVEGLRPANFRFLRGLAVSMSSLAVEAVASANRSSYTSGMPSFRRALDVR